MNEQLPPSTEPKRGFFTRYRLPIKLMTIGFLVLLLLIPTSMVSDLILERQERSFEANTEVTDKWGGEQRITGPILSLTNRTKLYDSSNIQILPSTLDITSQVETQNLKRGMYDVVVYTTQVTLSGTFELPEELYCRGDLAIATGGFLNIGLTDLRGLSQEVLVDWQGQQQPLSSGIRACNVLERGVSTPIDLESFVAHQNRISFRATLSFSGSSSLLFAPLGGHTTATISSNYPTPSFDGQLLPTTRRVSDSGFKATWDALSINRSYPQVFTQNYAQALCYSSFGVNLLTPVDQYQQAMRTAKYAFLIIILTFVLSFFVEMVQKRNIHPFQYLLIGLTLCLFYTLLVSFSEHLGFDWAYLIASIMTVGLITAYLVRVLKIKKTALAIGGVLSGLYGYIYILIQLETYALLTGSIGLFVVMALIMYFSQQIKWGEQ